MKRPIAPILAALVAVAPAQAGAEMLLDSHSLDVRRIHLDTGPACEVIFTNASHDTMHVVFFPRGGIAVAFRFVPAWDHYPQNFEAYSFIPIVDRDDQAAFDGTWQDTGGITSVRYAFDENFGPDPAHFVRELELGRRFHLDRIGYRGVVDNVGTWSLSSSTRAIGLAMDCAGWP